MSAPVLVRRVGGLLAAADPAAQAAINRVRPGEFASLQITVPRNNRLFKKYWVMCGEVARMTELSAAPENWTAEQVSDFVKVAAGHYDLRTVRLSGGRERGIKYPRSISFAKMSEHEFRGFYSTAVNAVLTCILPAGATTKAELQSAVDKIILGNF